MTLLDEIFQVHDITFFELNVMKAPHCIKRIGGLLGRKHSREEAIKTRHWFHLFDCEVA